LLDSLLQEIGDLEQKWLFPIFDKPLHQDRWEDSKP